MNFEKSKNALISSWKKARTFNAGVGWVWHLFKMTPLDLYFHQTKYDYSRTEKDSQLFLTKRCGTPLEDASEECARNFKTTVSVEST